MTPQMISAIVDSIIRKEGTVYTNHPKDKGGPTKFGITQRTLSNWRKKPVTSADVQDLTEAEAREIYAKNYITGPRFDLINDGQLAGLLIDWGVTSGPDDAVKGLQTVLGQMGAQVKIDGILGPITAGAANAHPHRKELMNHIVAARVIFHVDDVQKRPDQLVFIEGWVRRALSFFAY